jgi:ABC-type Zn uptake system ZnuABC Zn-binding protein ZnuA
MTKGDTLSTQQVKNIILFAVLVFSLLFSLYCETSSTDTIKITTTTSLLGSIVREIGKERVNVVTIVPAGMCPGHFDVTAENIKDLSDSRVLLNHGWEVWIDKLLAAVDNKPVLSTIDVEGNLMVPDIQKKATAFVTTLLCSLDRAHQDYYRKNYATYTSIIDSLATVIKTRVESVQGAKIVGSDQQVEFLEWLGLDVVMTYGRAEELTPKLLSDIISQANKDQVQLVVDNLQSGPDIGLTIAEEINARHINLSNFPLHGSYPDALMENFNSLMQVLQ